MTLFFIYVLLSNSVTITLLSKSKNNSERTYEMRTCKFVSALLVMLMVLSTLVACGQAVAPSPVVTAAPGGAAPSGQAASGAPVEIEYWNINNESFGGPAVADLVDTFNATVGAEKGIKVINRFITDGYGNVSTSLLASVASGIYPGVIQMNYANIEYISANFPYVSPEKLVSEYFPEDASFISDNFSEEILSLGRDGQGNLVGIPYSVSNPIMFINEDLFTQAGLDPKTDVPTTFAEVYEVGKIIHEKTGKYGFYLQQATDNWAQQGMLESAGGKLLTYVDGKPTATFDNPKMVAAYDLLAKMYAEGISPNISESDGQAVLAAGEIAMHIMTCGRTTFAKENLKFHWSTAKFPTFQGETPSIPCGGNILLIVADSDAKKMASWEFMKYMYEPENLVKWTMGTGYLPPRQGVAENELADYFKENIALAPALEQMKYAVQWTSWPGENGLEINQIMIDLRDSVITGQKTAQDAMKEAAAKVNELLQ